jgi:hypothetical protein
MIVLALGATVIAAATLTAVSLLLDIDAGRASPKARVF